VRVCIKKASWILHPVSSRVNPTHCAQLPPRRCACTKALCCRASRRRSAVLGLTRCACSTAPSCRAWSPPTRRVLSTALSCRAWSPPTRRVLSTALSCRAWSPPSAVFARRRVNPTRNLAFTRYPFTSKLSCSNQSSFYCPLPPAMPTLLQCYCMSNAQYTTPPRPPIRMPCTIPYW